MGRAEDGGFKRNRKGVVKNEDAVGGGGALGRAVGKEELVLALSADDASRCRLRLGKPP